jgi:hypothetical protein
MVTSWPLRSIYRDKWQNSLTKQTISANPHQVKNSGWVMSFEFQLFKKGSLNKSTKILPQHNQPTNNIATTI